MELTVKLLRSRLQSRLALHKQFASLGECWAPCPSSGSQDTVAGSCRAPQPSLGTGVQWQGPHAGKHLFPCSVKLQVAVVLNPSYSRLLPIFSQCLNWEGEWNSSNHRRGDISWLTSPLMGGSATLSIPSCSLCPWEL